MFRSPKDALTIEDCLELVAGISQLKFHDNPALNKLQNFELHTDNHKIMFSIAKQVFKGTALTERQYTLVQKLLVEYYTKQFEAHEIDIKDCIERLRHPLRKINEEHWIKLLDYKGMKMLVIRFPFNKKVLKHIEDLKNSSDKEYWYEAHKHFFPYEEKYVWKLVTIAKRFDRKFEIEPTIMEVYNKLVVFHENKQDYIPGIYDYKIRNIPKTGIEHCENSLGESPNKDNLWKFYDRRFLYGFQSIDSSAVQESYKNCTILTAKLTQRGQPSICVNEKKWTLDQVLASIHELDRYPLLIVCDPKTAYDELVKLHSRLVNYIPVKQMSVMFRLDAPKGNEFNHFVREKGLNNLVDNKTKVVYINSNKVPKPLIRTSWRPLCSFTIGSKKNYTKVDGFIMDSDLYIQYDSDTSQWHDHGNALITGMKTEII
jgi:hypothetical protein